MSEISGSFKKVAIGFLLAGFSSISLNSKAEIYEAILSGTSDYSDATIELGLQGDSTEALDYFDIGLSMKNALSG